MMTEIHHAIANAQCWLETISAGMTALDRLEGLAGEGEAEAQPFDGDTFDDADALRERLQEMALAVDVRSGWHSPGNMDGPAPAEEYQILLTTGGPALRIVGDLSTHGDAETARLEYQDWGTPWTAYTLANAEAGRVLAFAGLFYFGA